MHKSYLIVDEMPIKKAGKINIGDPFFSKKSISLIKCGRVNFCLELRMI